MGVFGFSLLVLAISQVSRAPVAAAPEPLAVARTALGHSPLVAAAIARPAAAVTASQDRVTTLPPRVLRGGVQTTLNRFRDALSIMDVDALKLVWPDLDERAVRARLAALREQNLEFDGCRISAQQVTATATCDGSLTVVANGRQRQRTTEQRRWQFRLSRPADNWVITRVAVVGRGRDLSSALF